MSNSTITLFDGKNFSGSALELTQACSDLGKRNFKDKTTSVKVDGGGSWVLFQYTNYEGDAWVVKPGQYPDAGAWHGRDNDALSARPVEELEEIEFLQLSNQGAFTVYLSAKYSNGDGVKEGGYTGSMPFNVGETRTDDLHDLRVPEGAVCWLFVKVTWGSDHTVRKERFVYRKGCGKIASYRIEGTTLDNSLHYDGIRSK